MKTIVLTFLTIIVGTHFTMAQRPPLKVTVEPTEGEFIVYSPIASPVAGGSYLFPGKAKDLTSGEYWRTSSSHATSAFGSQLFAYDMVVTGWNEATKSYTDTVTGATGCANNNHRVYGKPVYAMADGEVVNFKNDVDENPMAWRVFGDSKTSCPTQAEIDAFSCSNVPEGSGGGNHISIRSGDELHSYAHLQKGSLNPNLLRVGARVKTGDKLGVVGNTGCSTAPHIHFQILQIHDLEQLIIDPRGNDPAIVSLRPLIFQDIYTIDQSKLTGRDPQPDKWTKVNDRAIPRPSSLIWASNTKPCYYNPDRPEVAVHGVAEADYQGVYEKARTCGYRPVWVDGYEYNDKNYYNAIFRYDPNRDSYARHKQTFEAFNNERQELEGQGYRIIFIDSYKQNAKAYFSTIYARDNGPETKVTAHLTASQHDAKVDEMDANGWNPIQVSAYSSMGLRRVTTLYQKKNVGSWTLRSHLTAAEFDAMVAEKQNQGMALVHVNAYLEFGFKPRFAAIWHEKTPYTTIAATRKRSASGHQTDYDTQRARGLLTRVVTGYELDNKMVFAAVWTN